MLNFFPWLKNLFAKKEEQPRQPGELLVLSSDKYHSRYLSKTPTVILYLPHNWKKSKKRYPVLYAHDGQNLFDGRTSFVGEWYLDDVIESLIKKNLLSDMIVVGIYNNGIHRLNEYTPTAMNMGNGHKQGGDLEKHGQFIVEELKPYIDKTFPTLKSREHTGIMGSSLGALASFYLLGQYPKVFSKAAVLSPSFWWDNVRVLEDIARLDFPKDVKIYIDGGWNEGEDESKMIRWMRQVYRTLAAKGLKDLENIFYHEDLEGIHNEKDWTKRSPMALLYLYGKFSSQIVNFTAKPIIKKREIASQIYYVPFLELANDMQFTPILCHYKTNNHNMVQIGEDGELIVLSRTSSCSIEIEYQTQKHTIPLPDMK